MKAREILKPVQRVLSTPELPNAAAAVLAFFGFARRRSRFSTSALLTAAALAGGTALVLSRSSRSRKFLSRLGQGLGGSVGRQLGNLTGQVVGAHPVRSAQLAERTSKLFSNPV